MCSELCCPIDLASISNLGIEGLLSSAEVLKCVLFLFRRVEGAGAFYKGLYPNLIRVVPATALTFVVYEKTSTYLAGLKKRLQTESKSSDQ